MPGVQNESTLGVDDATTDVCPICENARIGTMETESGGGS